MTDKVAEMRDATSGRRSRSGRLRKASTLVHVMADKELRLRATGPAVVLPNEAPVIFRLELSEI